MRVLPVIGKNTERSRKNTTVYTVNIKVHVRYDMQKSQTCKNQDKFLILRKSNFHDTISPLDIFNGISNLGALFEHLGVRSLISFLCKGVGGNLFHDTFFGSKFRH